MKLHRPVAQMQKRLFAWGMSKTGIESDRGISLKNYPNCATLADLKQQLFAEIAEGETILEIGPGAGSNLCYYPKNIHWIGIEPNPFMHPYLKQEAEKVSLRESNIYQGFAETIPVDNHCIDIVIGTHVLCSVNHLQTSLKEILRILKPGGKFIFIEHIAARSGTKTKILQDSCKPIWQLMFDNCHVNRETGEAIANSGFDFIKSQEFTLSFPIVSPHIAGIAIGK
ncbi:MAG: class I SAM-dependent methyltransferase [Cyanobacteria bacterium P01_E01_bin.42]